MALIPFEKAASLIGASNQTLEEWATHGLLDVQAVPAGESLGQLRMVDEEQLYQVAESMGWLKLSLSQSNSVTLDVPPGGPWLPWLCASLACLFIFTVITWLMLTNDGLQELDRDCAVACQEHAESHALVRELFLLFTHVGGRLVLAVLACVAVLAAVWRKHFLLAGIWILATGGGGLLNLGVKGVIDRPRPGLELRDPSLHLRHDSFPSGHAMGSTIGYGMCLYAGFLFLRRKQARIALALGLVLLIGLIGFSRIYLRAHWFSDILGGYALGAAWLLFCVAVHRWRLDKHRRGAGL